MKSIYIDLAFAIAMILSLIGAGWFIGNEHGKRQCIVSALHAPITSVKGNDVSGGYPDLYDGH